MKKAFCKTPEFLISAAGLLTLGGLYLYWCVSTSAPVYGRISAFVCAALFAGVCLRFVPGWMDFWRKGPPALTEAGDEPPHMGLKVFLGLLTYVLFILLLTCLIRVSAGYGGSFKNYLPFWTCADSAHYLDIARDGYLSEGSIDRLVQLVFLPGYPLAVRLVQAFVGDYLYAGLLVSALSFAGAGWVIYRLARLDMDHNSALRTVKYLCLMPGAFFFAAPMSESLFLLLCALCVYCARKDRWLAGCLFGALAAFTRSLGLMLFVPLFFELVASLIKERKPHPVRHFAALLLIPLGFGAYCAVNYFVSGDPFKFMEYQREHWGQQMGFFFNTASYQLREAVEDFASDPTTVLGLWLPNLLCVFGSLALMLFSAKRLRPSYTAWFIACFVIAIGATWLLSAPRYLAALIPLPLALSSLSKRAWADNVLTVLLTLFSLFYLVAFALRWQVW